MFAVVNQLKLFKILQKFKFSIIKELYQNAILNIDFEFTPKIKNSPENIKKQLKSIFTLMKSTWIKLKGGKQRKLYLDKLQATQFTIFVIQTDFEQISSEISVETILSSSENMQTQHQTKLTLPEPHQWNIQSSLDFYSSNLSKQNKIQSILYNDFLKYNDYLTNFGIGIKRIELTKSYSEKRFVLITNKESQKANKYRVNRKNKFCELNFKKSKKAHQK